MNKYIPLGACVGVMLFSIPSFASLEQECQMFPLHKDVVCSEALPTVRNQLGVYAPPSFDPNTLRSVGTTLDQFRVKPPEHDSNGKVQPICSGPLCPQ